MSRLWRKSRWLGGYWGWFWNKRWLWVAMNEGGRGFALNLRLWRGVIPVGYYLAIRVWGDVWIRSSCNLRFY